MTTGFVFAIFFLLSILGAFILYSLVRSEHDQRETMDRERAEQAARRDTDDKEY
ncbi:hypothetical protein [Halobellus sp. H-GB7]|uniref:hypothetical protein n=1 Tax=Halobellus sp. H-GB7 TaxID=3069756 RepID=UPI0027B61224|nr:hypothetical protein [Halobellus sp. H-GB7]MDQ2055647.1 hypothetical protein [Halobellus sp. H-GB7]